MACAHGGDGLRAGNAALPQIGETCTDTFELLGRGAVDAKAPRLNVAGSFRRLALIFGRPGLNGGEHGFQCLNHNAFIPSPAGMRH